MTRRSFAAGAFLGAALTAAASFGIAVAVQDSDAPSPEGYVMSGQEIAFITADPTASPVVGRLVVRVDGAWRETAFEARMVPAD